MFRFFASFIVISGAFFIGRAGAFSRRSAINRLTLLSDGLHSMENDIRALGNEGVIVEDGVAKLADRSAFAGSVCTTNRLVRNMINLADVTLLDAVRMMTANPARMSKLEGRGAILEGNFADILIFDEDINVSLTMVNGNVVFEA